MDVAIIVAGALLAVWPLQYRRSTRRIRRRVVERNGDIRRFDRTMNRRWIGAALVFVPIAGVALIVLGAIR